MLHILTLNWNGFNHLSNLKPSLLPAINNIDFIWHIKDNGSIDDSTKLIESWNDKRINLIKYKDNLQNFSEGNNLLFEIAQPADDDLILLLNNDIVINDTSSLEKMIMLLTDDVGIVGCKLLYMNSNRLQHAGVVFTEPYRLPINYRPNQIDDSQSSKNRYYQAITGAVMLMRGSMYKSLPKNKSGKIGMDTEYIFSFEDIDLCLHSLYNMRKKVVYCGSTSIFHEESASLKKNALNKLFLNRNANYFLNKWKNKYLTDRKLYDNDPNLNIIK